MTTISTVTAADLDELLPLMRAYCDFYEVAPSDSELLALSLALVENPTAEGVQFIGRADDGSAIGFATVFWSWATTSGGRQGIMHDLFVTEAARGTGIARALIDRCVEASRERGCVGLIWQTALDNHRAQTLYDRTGAEKSTWHEYGIEIKR
ncbi:MAG: GNAT family N-acetyltransferase [Candidatus Nanopelagicales bacterium]